MTGAPGQSGLNQFDPRAPSKLGAEHTVSKVPLEVASNHSGTATGVHPLKQSASRDRLARQTMPHPKSSAVEWLELCKFMLTEGFCSRAPTSRKPFHTKHRPSKFCNVG